MFMYIITLIRPDMNCFLPIYILGAVFISYGWYIWPSNIWNACNRKDRNRKIRERKTFPHSSIIFVVLGSHAHKHHKIVPRKSLVFLLLPKLVRDGQTNKDWEIKYNSLHCNDSLSWIAWQILDNVVINVIRYCIFPSVDHQQGLRTALCWTSTHLVRMSYFNPCQRLPSQDSYTVVI